jgi:predicted secreted protein
VYGVRLDERLLLAVHARYPHSVRVRGHGATVVLVLLAACSTGSNLDLPRDSMGRTAIVLGEEDDNRSVGLSPGASVAVQLPSDPPDGDVWRVDSGLDESVLRLASIGYRPKLGAAIGQGLTVFTFQAVGPGSVTVSLSYGPQGDPASTTREFSFVVSVT